MVRHEMSWTVEEVAARFEEAVVTARRLPPVRVQGYFNTWPQLIRQPWEVMSSDTPAYRPLPPSPAAVERMLEVIRWIEWLEVEQRHLVWMRAKRYRWRDITRRFACDRTTAWRRYQGALFLVVHRLNTSDGKRVSD